MTTPTWGRVHEVILPSRSRVLAKRVSLTTLLWAGGFPAALTGLVWKMFNQEGGITTKEMGADPEALEKMVGIIEQIVPHVLVSPKVGEETKLALDEKGILTGTVRLADIDDWDKQHLMLFGQGLILTDEEKIAEGMIKDKDGKWVNGAAAGPQSFRDGAVRDDAGSAGAEVPPAAVGTDWDAGGPGGA